LCADVGADDGVDRHGRAQHIDYVARVQAPGHAAGTVQGLQPLAVLGDLGAAPALARRSGIRNGIEDGADIANDLDFGRHHLVGVRHAVDVDRRHRQRPGFDQLDCVEADRQQ
jgi:hypothetical protein